MRCIEQMRQATHARAMFMLLNTPTDLSPWVQCIWTMTVDGCEQPELPVAPDGCCEWIVNLATPSEAWRDCTWIRQPRTFLFGQLQGPLLLRSRQTSSVLGVRLRAYAASSLFRIPGSELHAFEHLLTDLLKGRIAVRGSGEFESLHIAYRNVVALLRVLAAEASAFDPLAVNAIARIERDGMPPRIAHLASQLGVTSRTLERRFIGAIGLTPKRYARIVRLQRGLRLIEQRSLSLADIAYSCGYADQAHMTREFADLAGRTPTEIHLP
jgi:AraC-like DNA-binding protein